MQFGLNSASRREGRAVSGMVIAPGEDSIGVTLPSLSLLICNGSLSPHLSDWMYAFLPSFNMLSGHLASYRPSGPINERLWSKFVTSNSITSETRVLTVPGRRYSLSAVRVVDQRAPRDCGSSSLRHQSCANSFIAFRRNSESEGGPRRSGGVCV